MDYLTQAKTFLHRANDTNDVEERMTHLNMAARLAQLIDRLGDEPEILPSSIRPICLIGADGGQFNAQRILLVGSSGHQRAWPVFR